MTTEELACLTVVCFVSVATLCYWLRGIERWLHMHSEDAKDEFVRELCRSLRNDNGWQRKGDVLIRERITIRLVGDDKFQVHSPFEAKCAEFTVAHHELVRHAVKARENTNG